MSKFASNRPSVSIKEFLMSISTTRELTNYSKLGRNKKGAKVLKLSFVDTFPNIYHAMLGNSLFIFTKVSCLLLLFSLLIAALVD